MEKNVFDWIIDALYIISIIIIGDYYSRNMEENWWYVIQIGVIVVLLIIRSIVIYQGKEEPRWFTITMRVALLSIVPLAINCLLRLF